MARSPRCEWPGCGARAGCCDLDHDLAWPEGPTCACNLGALCRHHHRVKQTGWTKTRSALGVRWTSPTGRSWHSPHPATPPARPTRPLPALPAVPDPAAAETRAGPGELAEDDWYRALADPAVHDLDLPDPVADDVDPDLGEPEDDLGRRLTGRLTTWTLDLADHTAWEPAAA